MLFLHRHALYLAQRPPKEHNNSLNAGSNSATVQSPRPPSNSGAALDLVLGPIHPCKGKPALTRQPMEAKEKNKRRSQRHLTFSLGVSWGKMDPSPTWLLFFYFPANSLGAIPHPHRDRHGKSNIHDGRLLAATLVREKVLGLYSHPHVSELFLPRNTHKERQGVLYLDTGPIFFSFPFLSFPYL